VHAVTLHDGECYSSSSAVTAQRHDTSDIVHHYSVRQRFEDYTYAHCSPLHLKAVARMQWTLCCTTAALDVIAAVRTSGSGGVIVMSLVSLGCTPNITGSKPCVCSSVSAAAGLALLPSNIPASSAPNLSLLTYRQPLHIAANVRVLQ
jgi:hypothetical protein